MPLGCESSPSVILDPFAGWHGAVSGSRPRNCFLGKLRSLPIRRRPPHAGFHCVGQASAGWRLASLCAGVLMRGAYGAELDRLSKLRSGGRPQHGFVITEVLITSRVSRDNHTSFHQYGAKIPQHKWCSFLTRAVAQSSASLRKRVTGQIGQGPRVIEAVMAIVVVRLPRQSTAMRRRSEAASTDASAQSARSQGGP